MTGPHGWIFRAAGRCLESTAVEACLLPTVADYQYELATASGAAQRLVAHVRGYLALVALMAVCLLRGGPMRNVMVESGAGLALGVAAGVVAVSGVGPAVMLVFLVVAILGVLLLRSLGQGQTYWRAFRHGLVVGLPVVFVCTGWVLADPRVHPSTLGILAGLSLVTACGVATSAVAAFLVWTPPVDAPSVGRRRCMDVLWAATVLALTFSLTWPLVFPQATVLRTAGVATLLFGVTVGVFGAVYLPVLVTAHRVVSRPSWVAILGALLFPIAMLALPFLQGRMLSTLTQWSQGPAWTYVLLALPYVAGGALLGWLLATREPQRSGTASVSGTVS